MYIYTHTMDPTFSYILEKIFERSKKDYITFSDFKKKMPVSVDSIFQTRVKNLSNKELESHIKPHLPWQYNIYAKGDTRYLLRRSMQEIITSFLKANPNISLNQVKSRLPFKRDELTETINDLIERGNAKIVIIPLKDGFGIRVTPAEEIHFTSESLKTGFNVLSQGKPYVKIYELRRLLSWPSAAFDSCLQTLWDEGVIELQASDPSLLDTDQQKDSYRDKTNTLRILLFWRDT